MTLDASIDLFRQVQTFEEYRVRLGQLLKKCQTTEEVNRAKLIIAEEKTRLLETNTKFKAIMDQRKRNVKMESSQQRAIHKAKVDTNIKMDRYKTTLKNKDKDIDDWVASKRIKRRTGEEAETAFNDKLGCPNPKCVGHGKNRGNVMNGVPTCVSCWHKLTPKSKFKDYNRAYWRRFNKNKKRFTRKR